MKITIAMAARMLQKNQQFVRIGLQRKLLPFGFAMRVDEKRIKSRYDYFINPKEFADYLGISMKELEGRIQDE